MLCGAPYEMAPLCNVCTISMLTSESKQMWCDHNSSCFVIDKDGRCVGWGLYNRIYVLILVWINPRFEK